MRSVFIAIFFLISCSPLSISEAQENAEEAAFGMVSGMYLLAKECADSGIVFDQEIITKIEQVIANDPGIKTIPQDKRDEIWTRSSNNYKNSQKRVTQGDCDFAYLLFQKIVGASNMPKSKSERSPF